MFEISAGGGGGQRASDRLNAGHPGSLFNRVSDRFKAASAAGVYRDIDNAYSAGGSDGNGSPQSTGSIVSTSTSDEKKRRPKRSGSSGSPGSSGGPSHTSAKKSWDYYEAPLAEKYHFGRATAYQEALANTAYRREMADMRKAGLNPSVIYGSHSSSGAETNIYPRDDSAGGSGGYGGSGGSRRGYGRSKGNYVFSGGAYYGLMTAAAVIGSVATKSLGGGMAAAGIAGTALKAINGFFKK